MRCLGSQLIACWRMPHVNTLNWKLPRLQRPLNWPLREVKRSGPAESGRRHNLQIIKRYVETQTMPTRSEWMMSLRAQRLMQQKKIKIFRLKAKYCVEKWHEVCFQIVCPESRSREFWKRIYEAAAHADVERTLSRICQRFYWPDIEKLVHRLHQGCVACSLQWEITPTTTITPHNWLYALLQGCATLPPGDSYRPLHYKFIYIFFRQWSVQESHRLKSEAAVQSAGTATDTSISVVRWQQGEQTMAVRWWRGVRESLGLPPLIA